MSGALRLPKCGFILAFTIILLSPDLALGFHTKSERITDDTAETPEQGMFRLGLFKAQHGIHDRFMMGTYTLPWLGRVASLYAKWRFYQGETVNVSARLGLFHLNTQSFPNQEDNPNSAKLNVAPFELAHSFRYAPKNTLTNALVLTSVTLTGELDNDDFDGAAEGAVSSMQYVLVWEHRFTRVTALVVTGRYLLFQGLRADADGTIQVDEFTTLEVVGTGNEDEVINFKFAYSIVPSFVFSWDTFNLRLGLGYGNYTVPGVNFTIPQRIPIPELDLYWVW